MRVSRFAAPVPSAPIAADAKRTFRDERLELIPLGALPRAREVKPVHRGSALLLGATQPLAVAAVGLATIATVSPAVAATVDAPPGSLELGSETFGRAMAQHGSKGIERLSAWEKLVNDPALRGRNDLDKAKAVHAFMQRNIRYTSDVKDTWSGPVDTIARGRGDCEDFAIAKYATLRALGVPAEKLGIAVGFQTSSGVAHAVLLFHESPTDTRVLDNNASKVVKLEKADFGAVAYEFNEIRGLARTQDGSLAENDFVLTLPKVHGALVSLESLLSP